MRSYGLFLGAAALALASVSHADDIVSTTWGFPTAAIISGSQLVTTTAVMVPQASSPGTPPSMLGSTAIARTNRGSECWYNNNLGRWEAWGIQTSGVTLLGINVLTNTVLVPVPCNWNP